MSLYFYEVTRTRDIYCFECMIALVKAGKFPNEKYETALPVKSGHLFPYFCPLIVCAQKRFRLLRTSGLNNVELFMKTAVLCQIQLKFYSNIIFLNLHYNVDSKFATKKFKFQFPTFRDKKKGQQPGLIKRLTLGEYYALIKR